MPLHLNAFRILADSTHVASKFILIWAIHSNKSAEGVSLITQGLYAIVFISRYLDLFWRPPWDDWYLFIFKIFYIVSSLYVILLMVRVFPRSRERERAWKAGSYLLGGSLVLAPIVTPIFNKKQIFTPSAILWNFSEVLESVCVLPQLFLLRQTDVPTVIDSYYLLALGSYRAFYILNWIYRHFTHVFVPRVSVFFGIIQVAFYFDFAWVYWTRQRIKLRRGSVVDTDDLDRGWLLRSVLGKRSSMDEEERPSLDAEQHPNLPQNRSGNGKWGPRGISVSADDGVLDQSRKATC
ncbi:MAG: hypothetical protein M1837_001975 [Sclerophora amabilis]|nr:MAG: hypothetical protein M1837_001975 [Sclerophora amabilis]